MQRNKIYSLRSQHGTKSDSLSPQHGIKADSLRLQHGTKSDNLSSHQDVNKVGSIAPAKPGRNMKWRCIK